MIIHLSLQVGSFLEWREILVAITFMDIFFHFAIVDLNWSRESTALSTSKCSSYFANQNHDFVYSQLGCFGLQGWTSIRSSNAFHYSFLFFLESCLINVSLISWTFSSLWNENEITSIINKEWFNSLKNVCGWMCWK